MRSKSKINLIEEFVKGTEIKQQGHGFSHTDRVRKWALLVAKEEEFAETDLLEAAALLHDIGRSVEGDRRNHGARGAKIARTFLSKENLFSQEEIARICQAISVHNKKERPKDRLSCLLKDGDILDLLGPIGIIRSCTGSPDLPEYDPNDVKGKSWQAGNKFFDERFLDGEKVSLNITDQLNFQISCEENLTSKPAKKIAKNLVKQMKNFILDLEKQVKLIS
jgi:putative nucleotidyltransferase with HDIG domain